MLFQGILFIKNILSVFKLLKRSSVQLIVNWFRVAYVIKDGTSDWSCSDYADGDVSI